MPGDALLQKTFTANTLDKIRLKNTCEVPQYYVEGSQPAIVSKEIFSRVQQELARRAALTVSEVGKRHIYGGLYALSGIVVCGLCGQRYRRVTWNNHGCHSIVWRCQHRLSGGKAECSSRTVNELVLKKAVVDAVNSILFERDAFLKTLSEGLKTSLADSKLEAINTELRKLQSELIDCAMNNRDSSRIELQISELQKEKAGLMNDSLEEKIKGERIQAIMDFVSTRDGVLESYDDSLVRKFVERIEIYDDRITVVLKIGERVDVHL